MSDTKNFGLAYTVTTPAGPIRRFRTFGNGSSMRQFAAELVAAGDQLLHYEQRIAGEWTLVERLDEHGQVAASAKHAPARLEPGRPTKRCRRRSPTIADGPVNRHGIRRIG